ncbi:MAG: hypothetical protein FWE52_00305 [Alphaproteobacteria bacterium]|nr:hypothetical protein [Alphaproteobacteria bacterium]
MKKLLLIISCMFIFGAASAAPNLTDTIAIERNAETAFAAKQYAMVTARRSAFINVASRYSDGRTVVGLAEQMSDADFLNMVARTSIADERTSATNYSANITVTLDRAALEKWFADNGVHNYMAMAGGGGARTNAIIILSGGLLQWTAMHAGLREVGIYDGLDLRVVQILGRNVNVTFAAGRRGAFIAALRDAGWNVSDQDGILRISR